MIDITLQRAGKDQYSYFDERSKTNWSIVWEWAEPRPSSGWVFQLQDGGEKSDKRYWALKDLKLALAEHVVSRKIDPIVEEDPNTETSVDLLGNGQYRVNLVGRHRIVKGRNAHLSLPQGSITSKVFFISGAKDASHALESAIQIAMVDDFRWDWGRQIYKEYSG